MIIRPSDLHDRFNKLRHGELTRRGLSTGFECLDDNIRLAKGFLLIVSGMPSMGKSEWLDAVLVNMTILHDWNILFYSPENHPTEQHMCKLAEKYIGKQITKFTDDDNHNALSYLDRHFTWMYPEEPRLDTLLKIAKDEHKRNKIDCLVLDPWNSITHSRQGAMIHEYLSESLSQIIRFARNNQTLVAVVAHPTKLTKDRDGNMPVPTLDNISDGAGWRSKADYGIIIHRPDMSKNEIEVHIGKIKNKWMGHIGIKTMNYNWYNGRFKGPDDKDFFLPHEIEPAF